MLRPGHLLDLLRNFTLFQQGGGATAKIVGRYHQFRAVQEAIRRLRSGQTRLQHGQRDQRGGVIWHTQGSGKSLTMVFLIRKMRTMPELRRFKVVVVTDRIDLEEQLRPVAALGGESIRTATSSEDLKTLLQEEGPGLVFAMIQKYQERADEAEVLEVPTTGVVTPATLAAETAVEPYRTRVERLVLGTEPFPELNASPDILVLVDEAHRAHTNLLHANLLHALPSSARIGFTGTPIMRGARKATHDIFGDFIDRYTIQQSEADGATVPILYEGRRAEATVADGRTLDELFDEMFHQRSPSEREAIRRKYATPHGVLEAPGLIRGKAEDMVRHYVDAILPNGLKAQVVAVSRRAAVVYRAALSAALSRLAERLERLDPAWLRLDDQELERRGSDAPFLVRAHRHLDTIKRLEVAAVISGEHNDDPAWREWSDPARRKIRIDRFKKPLLHRDAERRDGLAFLCVKNMLLTGFDAHVLQVLYLDRFMRGHELLQAIARVNRTHPGKRSGIVVDYFGIGDRLAAALSDYDEADVRGALVELRDELPKLDDRHRRVVDVFQGRGIAAMSDVEACVFLLRDVRVRADFLVKLRQFIETLDTVLPRPEGLPYVRDARILGFIAKTAANLYRDSQLDLAGAGRKVRELIDRYLEARGVYPTVPPVAITDAEFERHVAARPSERTRALEMEHALRHHITRHLPEDPARYRRLSERLEEILRTLRENWAGLVQALRPLVEQARQGRQAEEVGLDPRTHGPFAGVLAEVADMAPATATERREQLRALTIEIVDHVRQEIQMVDFWRNAHAQDVLRGWLVHALDASDLVPFELQEETADRLVELAKALHTRLVA
jgi:type I restriction enzyme R subunit